VGLFEQQLSVLGLADLPQQRMAAIDAASPENKKRAAEEALAKEKQVQERERLLAQGPPEKLYSLASREEQARNYDGAMDALRAIVENFPKSELFPLAVQRMSVIQDKLDKAEFQQAQQTKQQQQQQNFQLQQNQMLADQKAQNYQVCRSRYDSCKNECDAQSNDNLMSGIGSALRGDRMGVFQSQLKVLSHDCSACDAIERECEAYR
jgi:outer membrane protein assembly factor BamD (BamD/ComL family)